MPLTWSSAPKDLQPRLVGLVDDWWPLLRLFCLIFAMYAVGAEVSWHSSRVAAAAFTAGAGLSWQSFGPAVGFAFFPPSGVSVAAMLLTRRARWPVIVAAIVTAELVVDAAHGLGLLAAFGLAGANALEPLVGASLVRTWCGGPPDLRKRADLARFVAGACLLGPLVGGLLAATIGVAYAGIWWPGGVLRWMAGDGLGALVVGAPIVLWPRQRELIVARRLETGMVVVLTAGMSVAAFRIHSPPGLLLLPLLAWAAFRLEVIGAALASAVLAFAANYLNATGKGMFAALPLAVPARLAMTQLYIAVLMLVALLIGQESAGRITAVKQRQAEVRERTRLQSLARLGELLAAALTPEEIGKVTAAQVRQDTGTQALALGVLSADGSSLQPVHLAGYPAPVLAHFSGGLPLTESSATADAVRTGIPVLIGNPTEYYQRYPHTPHWMTTVGAASMGVWPLTAGDRTIGALALMWSEPQPLDAAQRAYASAVATMVTQALTRAQIYADEQARAAMLQAAVLPDRPGDIAGLDIAVCYQPAGAGGGPGGDWWDAISLPKDRIYLAVGDVLGHGLPAVEDMAQLRAAGRALAVQGLQPEELLAELNIFTGHVTHGKYATMTVAIFDSTAGALRYGSAGHPPALLRRRSNAEVIRLDGGRGTVLGPLRETYAEGQVLIVSGDILVMYTDGLIERRGQDLDTAITQAQQHITGWQAHASLHEACEQLTATLAPPPHHDDVCVLAIRFL